MSIRIGPAHPIAAPTQIDEPSPEPAPEPDETAEANPFLDELGRTKVSISVGNDNLLAALGAAKNNQIWAVGDDFGLTHRYEVRCTLVDREQEITLGHDSQLYTRATANQWVSSDGRTVVEQEPIEISRLFFEVREQRDSYFAYGGSIGLRNPGRELPGLAMWQQNRFHHGLAKAPVFANRATEGLTPFLQANATIGERRRIGALTASAEATADLSTDPRAIHARALIAAELRFGPLSLTASELIALFTKSNFSFETRFGIALELDPILVGAQLSIPNNHAPNRFVRFSDRDPILDLKVEVSF